MKTTSSCEKLTQWAARFQAVAVNSAVPVPKPCWNAAAAAVRQTTAVLHTRRLLESQCPSEEAGAWD